MKIKERKIINSIKINKGYNKFGIKYELIMVYFYLIYGY